MIPGGVTPRIYASQNDHGLRVFVFNLVDENGGYAIPSGTTALLNVLKPDRTVVSETCTWSGSTVTADCTEQMTAVAGNVHCEVRLVAANGDAVGSANFILGVESNPLASGVVSESDFDSISDMVDRAVAAASIPTTYVTDWLDENITQETGYVLDKSLTIENAAADAKAAGDLIRASFVVGEASGSVASFPDGADNVPVKDLVVNIQPKQSGTGDPSPTNVRAISGWTEANIRSRSINIWDEEWALGYYKTTDGTFVANTSGYIASKYKIAVKPSTQYFFYTNAIRFEVFEYGADKAFLRCSFGNANNGLINTSADAYYITFSSHANNYGATYNYDLSLNYPSTDTAYHASNLDSTVYNIGFGSAGTVYGGTLDVTSGMLTVTHTQFTLSSLPEKSYVSARNQFVLYGGALDSTPLPVSAGFAALSDTFTNYYTGSSVGSNSIPDLNFALNLTAISGGQRLIIKDTAHTSMDAFIAAYGNAQFVVPLAQPVSYQLTPTEVVSLLGNNNIFADTGSVASCEYRADTKLYLEKLTNPDDDMVANANITSGSYFMVGNNLYLATANIANGATIIPGTNCTRKSLAEALNEINA